MSIPVLGASRKTSSSSMNRNVENIFEFCLRALLPSGFPCGDRYGEDWVSAVLPISTSRLNQTIPIYGMDEMQC